MRTDLRIVLAVCTVAVVVAAPTPVVAQTDGPGGGRTGSVAQNEGRSRDEGPSLFLVDSETQVGSLGFRFPSGNGLGESRLKQNIALRGPGSLPGLRAFFDFLPGLSGPTYALFSPVVLQRDVVRSRRLYRRAGYPDVSVDYDVALDTTSNRVSVTLVVDQGQPLLVDTVSLQVVERAGPASAGADSIQEARPDSVSRELELPEDVAEEWQDFQAWLASDSRERRFGEQEQARIENEVRDWLLERGYPWARASIVRSDTTGTRVAIRVHAVPGIRARVEEVRLEGNDRLDHGVLLREIPIRSGDLYDASKVSDGERELYELDLIRRALGGVAEGQERDSTVVLRYRLDEGLPRLIWGRVGWRSESGVAAEAHWAHRDFFGGARSFTVSANGETGWAALEAARGRSLGVSALVRQPYVMHRNLSASFGPFARFRDDFRDESFLFGVESSLIFRRRPLQTVTLQHVLSRLRVDDAVQLTPIREVVMQGDSVFGPVFAKSVVKVLGAYGTFDDRIDPRSGFLVEPNVQASVPAGVSDVDFVRLGVTGMAAVPVTEGVGFFFRSSAGRLFPFGESDPGEGSSRTRAIIGLRDVMFTAGGTSDVRGWGRSLLGSKIPDVQVDSEGNVSAQRFVPAGGLARVTGSAEVILPFPFLSSSHRTFAFFDSGRVWSPGSEFDPADPELVLEGWRYGVGGGAQFGTLVGPIRISVGYKLNPTRVDLLGAGEVARALVDGIPLEELATDGFRRWHLHISIGRGL